MDKFKNPLVDKSLGVEMERLLPKLPLDQAGVLDWCVPFHLVASSTSIEIYIFVGITRTSSMRVRPI